MSTSRRLVPALQAVTLVALTAAALLLAWPVRIDVAVEPPALQVASVSPPDVLVNAAVLVDSVVNTNVFSLTREAPEERTFVAAPTDAVADDVTAGEYGADAGLTDTTVSGAASAEVVPALYGVVDGPLGRAALLRLDPNTAGSRLFHTGEGTAGYRVRSIGAGRVELTGPSGPVVLELAAKSGTP